MYEIIKWIATTLVILISILLLSYYFFGAIGLVITLDIIIFLIYTISKADICIGG